MLRSVLPILLLAAVALACDRGEEKGTKDAKATPAEAEATAPAKDEADAEPKVEEPIREPASLGTPPPKTKPSLPSLDAAESLAADLVRERDGEYFPRLLDKPSNGPAFLWIALHSIDPNDAAAALRSLRSIYGTGSQEREVDDDYRAVILYRLASDMPMLVEPALEATKPCITDDPGNADVIGALVHFAVHHPEPAGRILALRALSKRWDPTSDVQDAFLHALEEDDPAFLALTLERVSFNFGHRFSKLEALTTRIAPLLKHDDHRVRGTAVAALSESSLGGDRAAAAARLLPLVEDPHPFVRAAVLNEMGTLRHLPALPTVIEHIDSADPAKVRFDWPGLGGLPGRESLLIHRESVGLVAQETLEDITEQTEHPFEPSGVGRDDADGGLAQGAKEARAWHEAHGKALVP